MAHPVGQRLRCDECGAEIVFTKACPCSEQEQTAHIELCCGKQMRDLGVTAEVMPEAEPASSEAHPA